MKEQRNNEESCENKTKRTQDSNQPLLIADAGQNRIPETKTVKEQLVIDTLYNGNRLALAKTENYSDSMLNRVSGFESSFNHYGASTAHMMRKVQIYAFYGNTKNTMPVLHHITDNMVYFHQPILFDMEKLFKY